MRAYGSQTKSADYKSFLCTHAPRHPHTIVVVAHTSTRIRTMATAYTLARARKRRRIDSRPRGYDVDGSRFNGGCNYIANEPEVETVRALLRPKEWLYALELLRSAAIDRRRLSITLATERCGRRRALPSFAAHERQLSYSKLSILARTKKLRLILRQWTQIYRLLYKSDCCFIWKIIKM